MQEHVTHVFHVVQLYLVSYTHTATYMYTQSCTNIRLRHTDTELNMSKCLQLDVISNTRVKDMYVNAFA